jgi:hypothetical protein
MRIFIQHESTASGRTVRTPEDAEQPRSRWPLIELDASRAHPASHLEACGVRQVSEPHTRSMTDGKDRES